MQDAGDANTAEASGDNQGSLYEGGRFEGERFEAGREANSDEKFLYWE